MIRKLVGILPLRRCRARYEPPLRAYSLLLSSLDGVLSSPLTQSAKNSPGALTRHIKLNIDVILKVVLSCLAHQLYCPSHFSLHLSSPPFQHKLESKKRFFVLFL
jgi:hypothetical protein